MTQTTERCSKDMPATSKIGEAIGALALIASMVKCDENAGYDDIRKAVDRTLLALKKELIEWRIRYHSMRVSRCRVGIAFSTALQTLEDAKNKGFDGIVMLLQEEIDAAKEALEDLERITEKYGTYDHRALEDYMKTIHVCKPIEDT